MTSPEDTNLKNRKRKKELEAKRSKLRNSNGEENKEVGEEIDVMKCEEGINSPPVCATKKFT